MENILFLRIPLRRGILFVGQGQQFICGFGERTEAVPKMETHWEVCVLCKVTTLHWIFSKMTEFTKCLGGIDFSKNS